MTPRGDLVIEVLDSTDGSGNYTGAWVDTSGIRELFFEVENGTAGVMLEYSSDGSTALAGSAFVPTNGVVHQVYARYIRFKIVSGSVSSAFWAMGRIWSVV